MASQGQKGDITRSPTSIKHVFFFPFRLKAVVFYCTNPIVYHNPLSSLQSLTGIIYL